jgi:hypothetical protein
MPIHRSLRAVIACVVLVVLVAACDAMAPIASLLPSAGPLLTVTTRGGECADGPCGSVTVVERDGRVHTTIPGAAELGQLDAGVLAALDAAIKTADYDAIRSVKFTGECPVNFDGQEVIYELGAPSGVERIASCETEIDRANPLFAAIDTALAEAGAPAGP